MNLHLAGADDYRITALFTALEARAALTSYFNAIRGKKNLENWIKTYKIARAQGMRWIMDSGVYTFMYGAKKDHKMTEQDLIQYTNEYIATMQNIKYDEYIVEMDVHKISTMETVKKLRKIFEKDYDIEKTIFVWHVEEKISGLEAMVKRYPYIALSIPELRKFAKASDIKVKTLVMNLIYRIAKINKKTKVHLLGCTQASLMENGHYTSTDSTSWLGGRKRGVQSVWTPDQGLKNASIYNPEYEKLENQYRKKIIPLIKDYEKKYGIDMIPETEKGKNYFISGAVGIMAYLKLERNINRRFYGII